VFYADAVQLDVAEGFVHAIFQSKPKGDSYMTRFGANGPHLVVIVWRSPNDTELAEHGVLSVIVEVDVQLENSNARRCFVYPIRRVACNRVDTVDTDIRLPLVELSDIQVRIQGLYCSQKVKLRVFSFFLNFV